MVLGLCAESCQIRRVVALAAGVCAAAWSPAASAGVVGREVGSRERPQPTDAPIVACSTWAPVCVHAANGVHPAASAAVLRAAEDAYRTIDALRLPRPIDDALLGGSNAFDLYVLPSATRAETFADARALHTPHDAASAFTILPPPSASSGCFAASEVADGIGRAIALGIDAGAETSALTMMGGYFASIAAPCGAKEGEAIDDFQRHPERAFATDDAPAGSLLFPMFLDDRYGAGSPLAVFTSLLVVASQSTPPGSFAFKNDPDVFDALRANEKARQTSLDTLLLEFAVDRAFVGSRDDGQHLRDVGRFEDLGRARFEWSVPFESLPRRLAPLRPIEPTGATYLWLDLTNAPLDASITFAADWEVFSVFRWELVKIDRAGAEVGRVDVASIFGATHAERTVMGVGGLGGLLVVGVAAGSPDRSHPFDPDEPPAPHSFTVTLAK